MADDTDKPPVKKKRRTPEEQKADLKAKFDKKMAKIDAQIKKKQAAQRAKERAEDRARKIVAGALALKHMQFNPQSDFTRKLGALIREYTISDRDRWLFDLEPLPEEERKRRQRRKDKDYNPEPDETF